VINIETRTLADGTLRYRPRWRDGGTRDGAFMVEVFADLPAARRFAHLVEAAGKRMPTEATLRAAGFAEIADRRYPAAPAPVPAAAPVLTVAQWCERYIDTVGASENTVNSYRAYLANYIDHSDLGAMAVTRTSPDENDFKKWRNAMVAGGGRGGKPLSGATVARVMVGLLRPTFDMVARKGRRDPGADLPLDNPLEAVKKPAAATPVRTRLHTDSDMAAVLAAATKVDPAFGDAVAFILGTGWRWGETFGLCRDGYDPATGKITVLTVLRRRGGVWVLSPGAKSRAGGRTMIAPAVLRPMLDARWAAAAANPAGLLFPDPAGGAWQYRAYRDTRWTPMLSAARALGLSRHITAHGLRRTNLTQLHLAQVPDQALAAGAGHSDTRLTLAVYVDTDDAGRILVADAAHALLTRLEAARPAA